VSQYSKLLPALAGAATLAVSQGLIDGTAAKWVGIVVGFLTAAGVYVAPANTVPDSTLLDRLRGELPPDDDIPTTNSPTPKD
jgi:hypothetical protein